MKHTYEKPVITVDAGMAEGVCGERCSNNSNLKAQLTQTNNLPQAASHPDAASSFYSFPSSALFLSSFFFFFTTRSLRKNALSISEHSSFSTPRSTFT